MIRFLHSSHWVGFVRLLMAVAVLILSGCGSSAPKQKGPAVDENLVRFNRAARQAYDKGRLEQAVSFYRKALEQAYVRDDAAAILDAQYNLALCLMHLQSYEEALGVVQGATTEMAQAGGENSLDLLLLKATILHRRGDSDEAWKITDQILSNAAQASSVVRSKTYFLRGLIAGKRGDKGQLRESIAALGQPEHPRLLADREELAGHLAMAEQKWDAATEAFDLSAKLRRETLDYRGMVNVLALAGSASEKAERTRESAIFYLRAGRSAALQGLFDDAQKWLNQSVKLASNAGEDKIIQEARNYLQQIEEK